MSEPVVKPKEVIDAVNPLSGKKGMRSRFKIAGLVFGGVALAAGGALFQWLRTANIFEKARETITGFNPFNRGGLK